MLSPATGWRRARTWPSIMTTISMRAWLLFLVLAVPSCAPVPHAPVAQQAGAFLVEFWLPEEFETWYAEHREDEARPNASWPLAPVYARPDSTAPRLGRIYAVTRWRTQPEPEKPVYLDVVLEFRPEKPVRPVAWIDGVDDWGDGVHTATRRVAGPWILLPHGVFGGEAWVRVEAEPAGPGLAGHVESIQGQLLRLYAGSAVHGQPIPSGHYYGLREDSTTATLRPEVPSDMPCGDDVPPDPPPEAVPNYRVPISALFSSDGRPRFEVAYPEGC